MYDLSIERRQKERRYLSGNSAKKTSPERRGVERRRDQRPLEEFPYLPQVISY